MEITGKLLPPTIDFATGRLNLIIAPNEDIKPLYEEFTDKDVLSVKIAKYKAKRSLDANAYYWVLITKLAKVLGTSNNELHNKILASYGQFEKMGNRIVQVRIPNTEEAERIAEKSTTYHLYPTVDVVDGMRIYYLMRGSSSYNTEEMARLIDGLITECKEAGISEREIATPDQVRELKERYGIEV